MVKYLSLHNSSFALRYFLTQMARPQGTVWHTPCFLSLGYGAVAVPCYFVFWLKSPNGDTASNFWRKKFPFFLKKNSPNPPCRAQSVSLLATDGFNETAQKCRQLRRNLSVLSGDTRQCCYSTRKKEKRKKEKDWAAVSSSSMPLGFFWWRIQPAESHDGRLPNCPPHCIYISSAVLELHDTA